jgi:hypothetical protein
MNLNVSQPKPRVSRVPGARPRRPGQTYARLTRVAQHLAELTPLSPVPFRIERGLDQDWKHTGGTRFEPRGAGKGSPRAGVSHFAGRGDAPHLQQPVCFMGGEAVAPLLDVDDMKPTGWRRALTCRLYAHN